MSSASISARRAVPARSTYRHGNLRRALIDAGIALARERGPGGVILREATRRAGVAPNAAYRHFANHSDLLAAVKEEALAAVAASMQARLDRVAKRALVSDAALARARVRAVGEGYLRFALKEPGLFKTAFLTPPAGQDARSGATAAAQVASPYRLLSESLDGLVAAGALSAERRRGAEYLAWSAVHGLALLAIEGPLRAATHKALQVLSGRVLDMVERGL